MKYKLFYKIIWLIPILFLFTILAISYSETGIFQYSKIDSRDLSYWDYNNGTVKGTETFEINGSKSVCWILIHSYASSPKEVRNLANSINNEFGDYIIAPKLSGHGEVPSHLLEKNLSVWYSEIDSVYANLSSCNSLNVVGSSFGGVLSLRLAQERNISRVYLLNPFFSTNYHFYQVLKSETYISLFSELIVYNKKSQVAQINNPEGLENHFAYWNMPYPPIKNSFDFIEETKSKFQNLTSPILIQHSKNDKTASYSSTLEAFKNIKSKKELINFTKSNHVLLMDYDSDLAINNIISFEKEFRDG